LPGQVYDVLMGRFRWRHLAGIFIAVIACVLLAGCLGSPGSPESTPVPTGTIPEPVTPATPPPTIPPSAGNTSENWAGYVVQTGFDKPRMNAVDAVEATWKVPAVNCTGTRGDYSAAFWIGIDGFTSPNVIQIGTESDCVQGEPQYYGWYELYPQDSVNLNMLLNPGDEVHARVEYIGNDTFQLSITDTTTRESFTIRQVSPGAARSSGEWIGEAPVLRRRILPLADFGPVEFTNVSITVNGVTGPVSSPGWKNLPIIMEARNNTIRATPTFLSSQGQGFRIIWEHS
jgi:hypothetical protein